MKEKGYRTDGRLRALVVADTNENSLLLPKARPGRCTDSLPTELVQPWEKSNEVAVVSWRWDGDGDDPAHGSRNLCAAIAYAKRVGIRHLLVDIISVDQAAGRARMIDSLQDFASYYETLPVICAYQGPGEDTFVNVQRPWIYSELQHMRLNTQRLVHVEHSSTGRLTTGGGTGAVFVPEFMFRLRLWHVVCMLLFDRVRIRCIEDLQFIVPDALAGLVHRAFARLAPTSPADYFLVVALLARAYDPSPQGGAGSPSADWGWITRLGACSLQQNDDSNKYLIKLNNVSRSGGITGVHVGWFETYWVDGVWLFRLHSRKETIKRIAAFLGIADIPDPLAASTQSSNIPTMHRYDVRIPTQPLNPGWAPTGPTVSGRGLSRS